jgi:hypothetical protein
MPHMGSRGLRRRGAQCASIAAAVLAAWPCAAAAAPRQGGPRRMGGFVERLAQEAETRGERSAHALAAGLGLGVRRRGGQDLVPVVLEPAAGVRAAEIDAAFIERLGGVVDARSRDFVRALVPAGALRALSDHPQVSVTRTSAIPYAHGGLGPNRSEATEATGADAFHTAGLTGAGVDVAVIDLGFIGLAARKTEGELGADTIAVDFSGTGMEAGTSHGVGVAEHVADMAPGARIHCIKVSDEVDLQNTADYLRTNGIRIANHSVGWVNSSYYDDTGPISGIVNASRDTDGVFWAVSSGNSQRRHWRGLFTDADGDLWHEFAVGDELLNLTTASTTATIFLNWDQYGNSVTDLDLYVYNKNNTVVARSEGSQTGAEDPAEALSFAYSSTSAPYTVRVKAYSGPTANLDMTLFAFYNDFEYPVFAASLSDPATAHGAFAVGAVNIANWYQANPPVETFSSQGPTTDGRLKPQIAAPDGTTSRTYGALGSFGTSFSSPTTAGAAALLLDQDPGRGAGDLESTLMAMAVDVGAPGADPVYGAGLLNLELAGCELDAECQDGAACNGFETCVAGVCTPGAAPNCDDGIACTTDACDENTDACTHTPNAGLCNDGNSCTSDTCDAQQGCVAAPVADGTACTDANACTTGEVCTGGTCLGGAAVTCDDGLFCNGAEACNPATGCVAGAVPCPSDGVACTVDCDEATDVCYQPSDALCNDNNGCTTEVCHPQTGCAYTAICAADLATETFETNTWSGGAGWLAAWTRSGDVSLLNTVGPHGGTRHVRLRRGTGTITRALNLSGVAGPRLVFWWKGTSFEGAENAVAQVSTNGSTWTTVATLTAAQANGVYQQVDADLSALAPYSANFRVRFKAQMGGTDDQLYVDDIAVRGTR